MGLRKHHCMQWQFVSLLRHSLHESSRKANEEMSQNRRLVRCFLSEMPWYHYFWKFGWSHTQDIRLDSWNQWTFHLFSFTVECWGPGLNGNRKQLYLFPWLRRFVHFQCGDCKKKKPKSSLSFSARRPQYGQVHVGDAIFQVRRCFWVWKGIWVKCTNQQKSAYR